MYKSMNNNKGFYFPSYILAHTNKGFYFPSYILAHTIGRRMVYPGGTSLMNTIVGEFTASVKLATHSRKVLKSVVEL